MAEIIICTRHRAHLLHPLIDNLLAMIHQRSICNVLIVNNSEEPLPHGIQQMVAKHSCLHLLNESQVGLSYARNRAVKNTTASWLVFLDDDVQLPADFLNQAISIIESGEYDCFGGMYYPWYIEPKPAWLADDFGQKIPLRTTAGLITPGREGFLSAGIFAVKKEALDKVGNFRTDLGMKNQIGYGEEDELQLRLHQAGYRIGFTPDWQMKHAVLPHKYSVVWQLKSTFAKARDAHYIHGGTALGITLLKLLGSLVAAVFKRFPMALLALIRHKDYYWQNAILDILTPICRYAGRWQGVRKSWLGRL